MILSKKCPFPDEAMVVTGENGKRCIDEVSVEDGERLDAARFYCRRKQYKGDTASVDGLRASWKNLLHLVVGDNGACSAVRSVLAVTKPYYSTVSLGI